MSHGDWQHGKNFPWPYKNGLYDCLSDPKYIKDRHKAESESLHGWYQNDGTGWEMNPVSPAEKARQYKKRKGI